MPAGKTKKSIPPQREGGGRLPPESLNMGELPLLSGFHIRQLNQIMDSRIDRVMAAHPVGAGQGKTSTLQLIVHNPGISQSELSEIFGRNRSAQSRLISELEARGLVRRDVDPTEKRRYNLYATDLGRSLVPGLEAMARESEREIFSALSAEEYEVLRLLLIRVMRENLGTMQDFWAAGDDP